MGILNQVAGHNILAHWGLAYRMLCWLLILLLSASPALAMDKSHRIKAAMIYQFAKYIRWPEAIGDTITFCTLGGESLGGALHTLQNKRVRNMRVDVRHVASAQDVLRYCQVVYISARHLQPLSIVLTKFENSAILTVSDMQNFTHQGGMINFVRRGLKQKFEINQMATTKANLKLSSKLLQIAIVPNN